MIKDTLELLKKKIKEIAEGIYGDNDFFCNLPYQDDFEEELMTVYLTSHISYLDEKIKEIENLLVSIGDYTVDLCENSLTFKNHLIQKIEIIKSSLQKEKSQAEELLNGL